MAEKNTAIEDVEICSKNSERIINECASMVKYVANRIALRLPTNVEVDDLVSVGVLGLMDAIEKFDPKRGAKFKTYAEFRVRGSILDELRSMDWVPRSVRQKASHLNEAAQKLQAKLGRHPDDEEIAREMGMSLPEFFDTLSETQNIPLLRLEDMGVPRESGQQKSLLSSLEGKGDADPQLHIRLNELKEIIANAIDSLPERERLLISLYYFEELTMREIGEVLGITESRVSQIHSRAAFRLRAKLRAFMGEES